MTEIWLKFVLITGVIMCIYVFEGKNNQPQIKIISGHVNDIDFFYNTVYHVLTSLCEDISKYPS